MDIYETLRNLIEQEHRYLELEKKIGKVTVASPRKKLDMEIESVRNTILLLRKRFNNYFEQ